MRMWLVILAISMTMQAPMPLPPDGGSCQVVIINGKACMVCPHVIQC